MQVEDETVYVEPSHLLACEETPHPALRAAWATSSRGLEFLALEGSGMVALSVASKPLRPGGHPRPAGLGARRLGHHLERRRSRPTVVEDRQLYEVMLPARAATGRAHPPRRHGRVLVEQTSS